MADKVYLVKNAILKLDDELQLKIKPYIDNIQDNITRLYSILSLYEALYKDDKYKTNPTLQDILRTLVVFLHETLEDFLRTLAANLLQNADEQALDRIPLLGINNSHRPEKFFLGKLVEFKGNTIDQVISTSISNYLEVSNFNNVTDLSVLLESMGLDIDNVSKSFQDIQKLMDRRHQIVHRGDKPGPLGSKNEIAPIDLQDIGNWIIAVNDFFVSVLLEVINKNLF